MLSSSRYSTCGRRLCGGARSETEVGIGPERCGGRKYVGGLNIVGSIPD